MAASIKEALKKAMAEKGKEPPASEMVRSLAQKGAERVVVVTYGQSQGRNPKGAVGRHPPSPAHQARSNKPNPVTSKNKTVSGFGAKKPSNPNISANSNSHRHQVAAPAIQARSTKQPPPPDYVLNTSTDGKLTCQIRNEPDDYVYLAPALSGASGQAHSGDWGDEREVVIGLDFGTSSVKVIVGDSVLDKALAVPFSSPPNVGRYLLPSRVYESNSRFSLAGGERAYRDLKLALLADPKDGEAQIRAAALLALVIRHAIAWLLSEHRDVYRQTNILWKLAVGLPAAHHLQGKHQDLFRRISLAAWLAASSEKQPLDREIISGALLRATQLLAGEPMARPAEAVEITVVPEIAAQIYGYVASNRFDRNGKNLFLMVDVGAGTVDSSLFLVKEGRGGRFGFTFYTSEVQPNGVMNLHRNRMQWWEGALVGVDEASRPDITQLHHSKFATDRLGSIPESYEGYFSGVNVSFRKDVKDPDQSFFMMRVVTQVRGKTMWRTWKDRLLTKSDLKGVPLFLCGGGTRMHFYRRLEQELQNMPGCPWLNAEARPLEVPRNLEAPGLPKQEYDRLSVAFGLSFLEVSEVVKATPAPKLIPENVASWQDNYIDKDQC